MAVSAHADIEAGVGVDDIFLKAAPEIAAVSGDFQYNNHVQKADNWWKNKMTSTKVSHILAKHNRTEEKKISLIQIPQPRTNPVTQLIVNQDISVP